MATADTGELAIELAALMWLVEEGQRAHTYPHPLMGLLL